MYVLVRLCLAGLLRLFFRFRTVGRQHLPETGSLLIAANHASYLDIPVLGCGITRQVWFLGRRDLFPIPGLRPVLRRLGWIPLRQDRLDRSGFSAAISLIKEAKAVAIYPEGSRSFDGRMGPGKPGMGVIVAETGCPVLPVYIQGTFEALPRGTVWPRLRPIRMVIGEPIDFSADATRYSGKEFYQYVSRTVMARIAELGHVAQPNGSSGCVKEAGSPTHQPAARPFNAE